MKRILQITAALMLSSLLSTGCATIRDFLNGAISGKSEEVTAGSGNSQGSIQTPKIPVSEDIRFPETISGETTRKNGNPGLTGLQERLIRTAKSKLGCRYSYSGKGPDVFDCSGFTRYVFGQEGIELSPSSRVQYTEGKALRKKDELRPCDLVFFSGRRISGTVGHVGMVLDYDRKTGEFTFIHAAVSTGIEIQKSSAEYYAKRYIGARRVLPDDGTGDAADDDTVEDEDTDVENAAPAAVEPEEWHTIKSGDTLSGIAKKYHTTVSELCRLNGISTRTILKIGRKLRVK